MKNATMNNIDNLKEIIIEQLNSTNKSMEEKGLIALYYKEQLSKSPSELDKVIDFMELEKNVIAKPSVQIEIVDSKIKEIKEIKKYKLTNETNSIKEISSHLEGYIAIKDVPEQYEKRVAIFVEELSNSLKKDNSNNHFLKENLNRLKYYNIVIDEKSTVLKEQINRSEYEANWILIVEKNLKSHNEFKDIKKNIVLIYDLKINNQTETLLNLKDSIKNLEKVAILYSQDLTASQKLIKSQYMKALKFLGFNANQHEKNIEFEIKDNNKSFLLKEISNDIAYELKLRLSDVGNGKVSYKAENLMNNNKIAWPGDNTYTPNKKETEAILLKEDYDIDEIGLRRMFHIVEIKDMSVKYENEETLNKKIKNTPRL